jgi:hypothetical protein
VTSRLDITTLKKPKKYFIYFNTCSRESSKILNIVSKFPLRKFNQAVYQRKLGRAVQPRHFYFNKFKHNFQLNLGQLILKLKANIKDFLTNNEIGPYHEVLFRTLIEIQLIKPDCKFPIHFEDSSI